MKVIQILLLATIVLLAGCQEKQKTTAHKESLIDYLHFVQKQHVGDKDQIFSRIRGYLDARYDYEKTQDAEALMQSVVKSRGKPENAGQAALWLDQCYSALQDKSSGYNTAIIYPGRISFKPKARGINMEFLAELERQEADEKKVQQGYNTTILQSGEGGIKVDAYGPGIHSNQYGQPVRLKPDFGGVYGERLEIKENAYGLGVHMDQYGRPVREKQW